MAIHNYALMYAQVVQAPRIKYNEETKEYERALCAICIIRGKRNAGDETKYLKKDKPIIFSTDPEIIKEMAEWKQNDIVEVEGTIATMRVKKPLICSHCQSKNYAIGDLTFINPIFAKKRESTPNEEAAINILKENQEISNKVFLVGRLCKDPKKVTTKSGMTITQYPLAINRKYRVKNSDDTTDYPWIKTYGENANEDMKRLHSNSLVYIDGMVQARSIVRKQKCEECGEIFQWPDKTVEIVPYAVEYLNDYFSDADLENKKKEEIDKINERLRGKIMKNSDDRDSENTEIKNKENKNNENEENDRFNDDDYLLSEEDKQRYEYGYTTYDDEDEEVDEYDEDENEYDED